MKSHAEQFLPQVKKRIGKKYRDIDPEDIFLDSANLPGFAENRFEGKIEKPISNASFFFIKTILVAVVILFSAKLLDLQIVHGQTYSQISQENQLSDTLIFANRGVIYDRNGVVLASNAVKPDNADFAARLYAPIEGLAHVVGYLKYPMKDSSGFYYQDDYEGQTGVEYQYDDLLSGQNGSKITETDALSHVISESVLQKPVDGQDITLAIDSGVTQELYKAMQNIAESRGFSGGAGVIMDVRTGEVLALSSYPDFDQNVVTTGTDSAAISKLLTDPSEPFLDRAVSGLYTPGSIVKPMVALGALNEGVIDPSTKILSTGSISVPNPYNPSMPTIFRDWRAQGWMTMEDALAVSSDVYFYEVGGGFGTQKGLGITNIDKYFNMFGLAAKTGIDLPGESQGTISSPAWKAANFNGAEWLLGDTYHTAIGQYGTQVTPLEAVRWAAAIANGGTLLVPQVVYSGTPKIFSTVDLPAADWQVVRAGMREGVTTGIVTALNTPAVAIAAKTGTAELGTAKAYVNSWSTGFWPYDDPHYAFAVVMEKGNESNVIGATYAMQQVIDWMATNTPQYFK